jgi:ATP-dependent RNA helicase RhlE
VTPREHGRRARRAGRPPGRSRAQARAADHLVRTRSSTRRSSSRVPSTAPNKLAEQLNRDGIAASAIHGNKSQPQRVRALDDFKAGRILCLVATEVAARGLDIEALPHVVNFELPMVPEDYVHRIGRTGRAGVTGTAVSLVCIDEAPLLREIERLLKGPIPSVVVPGFEPNRAIAAQPIKLRSGMHGGQRRQGPPSGPRRQGGDRDRRHFGGQRQRRPRRTAGSSIGR